MLQGRYCRVASQDISAGLALPELCCRDGVSGTALQGRRCLRQPSPRLMYVRGRGLPETVFLSATLSTRRTRHDEQSWPAKASGLGRKALSRWNRHAPEFNFFSGWTSDLVNGRRPLRERRRHLSCFQLRFVQKKEEVKKSFFSAKGVRVPTVPQGSPLLHGGLKKAFVQASPPLLSQKRDFEGHSNLVD